MCNLNTWTGRARASNLTIVSIALTFVVGVAGVVVAGISLHNTEVNDAQQSAYLTQEAQLKAAHDLEPDGTVTEEPDGFAVTGNIVNFGAAQIQSIRLLWPNGTRWILPHSIGVNRIS